MNLTQPLSRGLSRSLSGCVSGRGSAAAGGLLLRATNNSDGTATLAWSGYNLTVVDPDGTWTIEYSTDGVTYGELENLIAAATLTGTYATLTLGTLYYFRVVAYDSAGPTVLKTSNAATTTMPYPWELSNVSMYLDFEPASISKMAGFRYTKASSQKHTAPRISALEGASAMTLEFWRGPSYNTTTATNETGFMGQGGAHDGGYGSGAASSGFRLCSSDTVNFNGLTLLTNQNSSTYGRAVYNGGDHATSHLLTYSSGTVRMWIDGVEIALASNDLAATLPTGGTELFAIGTGYRFGDYTWHVARVWNRAITPTEALALTQNRKIPVLYSALESTSAGITTSLLRNWETADLQCKVTSGANGLLTAVNSPTTEEVVYQRTCRKSSKVFSGMLGKCPTLVQDTFKAGRGAGYNGSWGSTNVGAAWASLVGETAPTAYTASDGGITVQNRPEEVGTVEQFNYSIYQGGNNYYQMPGMMNNAGTMRFAYRWRNQPAAPNVSGNYWTNVTPVVNTNYITTWKWTASAVDCVINDVAATVTANFGGTEPKPNAMLNQDSHANTYAGGDSWKGRDGVTIRHTDLPSEALLTQIKNYIS